MANQSETANRTDGTNLPMVINGTTRDETPNAHMFRYSLLSSFASQLVASKLRLNQHRTHRRAPTSVALEAYRDANSRKIKRIPAGYNRALDA